MAMQHVYLSRRNLLGLLSKLDRAAKGEPTMSTIIKADTVHPRYPCSSMIMVTAVEDEDYYTDRRPGEMHPADEPADPTAPVRTDDSAAPTPKI